MVYGMFDDFLDFLADEFNGWCEFLERWRFIAGMSIYGKTEIGC